MDFRLTGRLLQVERISHDCILAEDTFQKINHPVHIHTQRASALRFADPKTHQLWHALVMFRLLPEGFRNLHLREHLAAVSGRQPEQIGQGSMSYQLRRPRLHGMIERIPKSHRYQVTEFGFRTALFFTRTYIRVLRSGLASALPDLCAIDSPLKRSFNTIEKEVHSWVKKAKTRGLKLDSFASSFGNQA